VDGQKEYNSTTYNISFREEFAFIIGFPAPEPNAFKSMYTDTEPPYLFSLSIQEFLFSGKFSLNIKSENSSMQNSIAEVVYICNPLLHIMSLPGDLNTGKLFC
jgi:hypothetical protein